MVFWVWFFIVIKMVSPVFSGAVENGLNVFRMFIEFIIENEIGQSKIMVKKISEFLHEIKILKGLA